MYYPIIRQNNTNIYIYYYLYMYKTPNLFALKWSIRKTYVCQGAVGAIDEPLLWKLGSGDSGNHYTSLMIFGYA